jgi:hypothetical protein
MQSKKHPEAAAPRALRIAAASWFVVTALGQLMFATYIAGFYGRVTGREHPNAGTRSCRTVTS